MSNPAYLINGDSVVVVMNGRQYVANKSSHPYYEKIIEAIKGGMWDSLPTLLDVKLTITQFTDGYVKIVDNTLYYNDEPLHNSLTERILMMFDSGFDIKPMVNFLKNLMSNPSRTAVGELFLFLEALALPITEDGCFLAYKKVRDDFKDIYSGKFDNSPGTFLEMPRNNVDDQRDRTCSQGLHFCSLSYLQYYGTSSGNKVVIVKINPKDVVSIPSDYNNAKGRTCAYLVVGEYTGSYKTEAFNKPVYTGDDIRSEFGDFYIDETPELDAEEISEKIYHLEQAIDSATSPSLINALEEEISELQEKLDKIDENNSSLQSQLEEKLDDLEAEEDEISDKIYNLRQSLDISTSSSLTAALQAEIDLLENRLSEIEDEKDMINARLID
jgi:polyhydroxyalkanoate synthesis regulator phasin